MKTLILDIDYTLNTDNPSKILNKAKKKGYGEFSKQTWDLFEKQASKMGIKPHPIPAKHYNEFTKHYDQVIIITGRPEKFRKWSEKWLEKNGFYYDELIHRPDAEIRMTSKEVKKHMVDRYGLFENPNDSVAIDDDEGVVAYYRSLGIKTFQAPFEWEKALNYHKQLGAKKMAKKSNRLTDVKKRKILSLREKGLTHKEIADEVGCAKSTVGRVLQGVQKSKKVKKSKTVLKVLPKVDTVDEGHKIDVGKNFLMTIAIGLVVGISIYLINLLWY